MKIWVNQRPQTLSKKDFAGAGGEGQVFIQGDVAFKLYTDPLKMIPLAKIKELSAIRDPNVIKPQEVITDAKGKPLGYTMRALQQTHPLCKLFTLAFKQRNNLGLDKVLRLVQEMRRTTEHVHQVGILIVDANELNFLVDSSFGEVYFIDVDSYQTSHFPATAIMDSVRDRHSRTFNEGTDWFSWGIVTWQLLTGIHPYKGKHPTLKSLDARMLGGVSVLHGDVTVPAICPRWEDAVPSNYLAWYKAIFEDGKRVPPPADFMAMIAIAAPVIRTITSTGNFNIQEIRDFGGDILDVLYCTRWLNHGLIVTTTAGVNLHGKLDPLPSRGIHFSKVERGMNPLMVWRDRDSTVHFREVFGAGEIIQPMEADGLLSYRGTVYLKIEDGLYELTAQNVGKKIIVSTTLRGNVMHRATQLFDGVAIQDMLGAWFATILPKSGECHTIPLPELKGYKILDAKFDGGILMVLASKHGINDRFIYKFNREWEATPRISKDVTHTELNFATLDTGICVHILEDSLLEIFHRDPRSQDVKVVQDPVIKGDMRLFSDGTTIQFTQGSKMYSLQMQPKTP